MGIIPGAAATGFGNEEERLRLTLNTRTSGDSAGVRVGAVGGGLLKQEGWGEFLLKAGQGYKITVVGDQEFHMLSRVRDFHYTVPEGFLL